MFSLSTATRSEKKNLFLQVDISHHIARISAKLRLQVGSSSSIIDSGGRKKFKEV